MKTFGDLQTYLLERMEQATDEKSKMNPSFTKQQIWNMWMGDCIKWGLDRELPWATKTIMLKRVYKDFK
jgi:hypothetical protein